MRILLAMILLLCGCVAPSFVLEVSPMEVSPMVDSTVVMVRYDEELSGYRSSCAGVWIGPDKILTAAHCVTSGAEFFTHREIMDHHLVQPHLGKVVKIDIAYDLALVGVIDLVGSHGWSGIEDGVVRVGEEVHIVGHPAGLQYTYIKGIVSALRRNRMGEYLIQVNSSAFFGNSGGGAFNARGKLVGICHSIHVIVPSTTYFVSHRSINEFLSGEDY